MPQMGLMTLLTGPAMDQKTDRQTSNPRCTSKPADTADLNCKLLGNHYSVESVRVINQGSSLG